MSDGSPTIRNCWFSGGYGAGGGGQVLIKGNSSPTFLNCTFINGATDLDGGSFRIMANAGTLTKLAQCRFLNCQATSDGGAIVAESGTLHAAYCEFTGCDSGQSGGAILTLGSAVIHVLHCSLAGNTAGQFGGGITTASGTTANVYNTVLWDNTSVLNPGTVQTQLYQANGSTINLRYSCAQFYNGALFNNPGNTGANPQFVNGNGGDVYGNLNDDLRPMPTSPLIDAGDNTLIAIDWADSDGDGVTFEAVPYDLDFNPRRRNDINVADTGTGTATIVDIGAYELGTTCPGDLDDDGDIDLDDLLIVLGDYGCTGDCAGDGDGNGTTDLDDLLYVLGGFGGTCN